MTDSVLLADIGNTRIKWALARGSAELQMGQPFSSKPNGLEAAMDEAWLGLDPPTSVRVSNVAGPDVADALGGWVYRHWRIPVRFARSRSEAGGVLNGYDNPRQLGVDRWLGLLGLARHHALPACVVDCGTAVTLDLLDGQGRHQGGLIIPGLSTMAGSLRSGTHALDIESSGPVLRAGLARDTATAIRSGCIMAVAGFVERMYAQLQGEYGSDLGCVLTGGDAGLVGESLSIAFQRDEALVLRGLLVEAESYP
jgi:type III pantothenate kinase